jgi:hypothetical protein
MNLIHLTLLDLVPSVLSLPPTTPSDALYKSKESVSEALAIPYSP